MNHVHTSFIHGNSFKCGQNVIIEEDVIVGHDVVLGHNVTLKSGTRIMNDVTFADYVKTTGLCIVGNHVGARTGACISKSVIINDWAFIGPGIMTNHTKNVCHGRPHINEVQLITRIGYGAVIGSMCSLIAGLTIGDNVVIAAGTSVYKDILEPGIWGGEPLRKIRNLDVEFMIQKPDDYIPYEFAKELLRKYLPNCLA